MSTHLITTLTLSLVVATTLACTWVKPVEDSKGVAIVSAGEAAS